MYDETPEHLRRLLDILERRLRDRELTQASLGLSTEPHIALDIEALQKQISQIKEKLGRSGTAASPARIDDDLAFQNQQEALNFLRSQDHIGNVIINAPAGYGKTYLIERITPEFVDKGWHVHKVTFSSAHDEVLTEHQVLARIMDSVGVTHREDPDEMGCTLAIRLRQGANAAYAASSPREGIGGSTLRRPVACLIIDGAEKLYSDTRDRTYSVLRTFFRALIQEAGQHDNFKLKVILAGRYLVDERLMIFESGKPTPIDLKVFSPEVIQQAVDSFFTARELNKNPDWIARIARNVLYVTGGHPRMIRDLLKLEAESLQVTKPEEWLVKHHHRLFGTIIGPAIADMQRDGPYSDELWGELFQLCVFREFNHAIIQDLFPQKKKFDYTDRLERYGLATRQRYVFRDGVLRPAMLRWLQFGQPEKATAHIRRAKDILQSKLRTAKSAIEVILPLLVELFHLCLLEAHDLVIQRDSVRRQNYHAMLEVTFKGYIDAAMERVDDQEEFIHAFRTLHSDTELAFLFDYIFKGYITSDQPATQGRGPEHHELNYGRQIDRLLSYCASRRLPGAPE